MIFGYSIPEARKTVIAVLAFGGSLAAMFIAYDPAINEAAFSIAGSLIGIIGVFTAPQFSIEDFSKYLEAFQGALLSMANFWVVLDPSWGVKATTLVGAIIALVAIKAANNEKPHNVAA